MKRNLLFCPCCLQGREELQKARERTFQYYERELASAGCNLHPSMDTDMEQVISEKQCLLLQQMAKDAGVGDEGLAALVCGGVKLTGVGGRSHCFEDHDETPALADVQLMKSCHWSRDIISGKACSEDCDVRREIWEGALEEVRQGWLQGPFTTAEPRSRLGPLFIVSKRFGLWQTDKVRPIDDMSQSLVNSAIASSYKLDPGDLIIFRRLD